MINQPIPDYARVTLSEVPGDPDDQRFMTVWFHWRLPEGTLDRPCSYGMSMLPRHVPRMIRAFLEGALFKDPKVAVDVDGRSYVAGSCEVYGKRINRDLIDLGY